MSLPDKDRRATGGSTDAVHVFRDGAGPSGALLSSSPPFSSPLATSRGKNIIAAPPRVQLNLAPSPSPEDQSVRPPNGTMAPRSRRNSNAPSTRSLAMDNSSAGAKEKDQRIAQLERELAFMETEFQRELDRLSQNESETASFWQAKHSALNQQFLRTDTDLRLLRDKMRAREAEAEELTRGWREALRAEAARRDDEAHDLRAQVRGLKDWVSTSTRTDDTVNISDEVFGESMARLGNGLQNWVITNFRRAKVNLSRVDEVTLQEIASLLPMYEELAQAAKVHLLQSIVSSILVRRIFGAYFVGLSAEQEEQLRHAEELMASFGSIQSVAHWRSVTLSILKKEAAESMQAQTTQTAEHVVGTISRILDTLTTDTAAKPGSGTTTTEARDQSLRHLVNSAIELSRLLVMQKAAIEVWMPEILPYQQVTFDHDTMEDIGGEDEECLIQRDICCVTFPGIMKRSDENGARLRSRHVISKARVLCSPE